MSQNEKRTFDNAARQTSTKTHSLRFTAGELGVTRCGQSITPTSAVPVTAATCKVCSRLTARERREAKP